MRLALEGLGLARSYGSARHVSRVQRMHDRLAITLAPTEAFGHGVPIVIAPHTNPALSRHPKFRQNVADLRSWGVTVLDPQPERPWLGTWERVLGATAKG